MLRICGLLSLGPTVTRPPSRSNTHSNPDSETYKATHVHIVTHTPTWTHKHLYTHPQNGDQWICCCCNHRCWLEVLLVLSTICPPCGCGCLCVSVWVCDCLWVFEYICVSVSLHVSVGVCVCVCVSITGCVWVSVWVWECVPVGWVYVITKSRFWSSESQIRKYLLCHHKNDKINQNILTPSFPQIFESLLRTRSEC